MNNLLQYIRLLSFFFILFVIGCKHDKKAATAPQGGAAPASVYPVVTIAPRQVTIYSDFPATIQGQQNIEIRPRVDGYIEAIYVDEGVTVKKGQLLFRISAPQYEQEMRTALAEIKIAQADVNTAQMQVNKVRPLVEKNIISKYELQSAEFAFQSRQAVMAQAQARLANARTNLGYTSVVSPVNGVVGSIPYKIGSLISSNTAQPLTTVSNIGNIYAYFSVNERQALSFSRSTRGASAQERLATIPPVTLILSDGSEFPQKGRVEAGSGIVNTQTGSFSVRATFPNPGSIIRSGSSGNVRIPRIVDSALLVPQKATFELQGKRFVYVLESTGTVKTTEIKTPQSAGLFFVVQEGLRAGDKIVVEGVASLRDGMQVKGRPVNADSLYNVKS